MKKQKADRERAKALSHLSIVYSIDKTIMKNSLLLVSAGISILLFITLLVSFFMEIWPLFWLAVAIIFINGAVSLLRRKKRNGYNDKV